MNLGVDPNLPLLRMLPADQEDGAVWMTRSQSTVQNVPGTAVHRPVRLLCRLQGGSQSICAVASVMLLIGGIGTTRAFVMSTWSDGLGEMGTKPSVYMLLKSLISILSMFGSENLCTMGCERFEIVYLTVIDHKCQG